MDGLRSLEVMKYHHAGLVLERSLGGEWIIFIQVLDMSAMNVADTYLAWSG